MTTFSEIEERDSAYWISNPNAPGVCLIQYWEAGADPDTDIPDATPYGRQSKDSMPRRVTRNGRKQTSNMTVKVTKDASLGLSSVDESGFIGVKGRVYRILAVDNGEAVWVIHAADMNMQDMSAGMDTYYAEGY